MVTITIIGTGYVGLVSGACLADFGNTVICVDSDHEKIARLQQGIISIYEPGLSALVEKNTKTGRLTFTTELESALKRIQVILIAVGTPPADDGSADLQYVQQVARHIGRCLEKYAVIVDKSTVPVGTGQKVKGWMQEEFDKRNAAV